ncbi:MAG: M23 family metallopeptidase [Bacteroidota bacterium]|nr:M23 family metallopeptidase [Bacteroidota bacterium]MEC8239447.1 M23 family metallopeptidase [Bacteroidota bacterium]
MRRSIVLVLFLISHLLCAQNNEQQDYALPIDIPIFLSGTFGELRSSNIHAGIDIKTQGREGFPIKAVSDGYVSRIKVSTYGYGKAIYINHFDGNTSVYAHLKKFSSAVVEKVREKQYNTESFEVELFLNREELPVSKNQIIGYSGNTGGSFGPHLHFELRETNTQKPINPLLSYYNIKDSIRPEIKALFAYPVGEHAIINASQQEIQIPFRKVNDSIYVAEKIEAIGKIGLGIITYDRHDNTFNKNGVYGITAKLNGIQIKGLQFSKIRFSDSEYLPTLIDYERYSRTRQRVQKLFRSSSNELEFFNHVEDGYIEVEVQKNYAYQIKVEDANHNNRYLLVPIVGKEQEVAVLQKKRPEGKEIETNRDYLFLYDGAEIYIPKNGVYDTSRFELGFEKNELKVEADHVALRRDFQIKINAPDSIDGHYLGVKSKKGKIRFVSNTIRDNQFIAKTKKTGIYSVAQDTIPPSIKPAQQYDQRWLSNFKTLRFTIDDKETGISSYHATIDGKWALFEYEPKKKELTFNFDEYFTLEGAKHSLEISVIDNVGNETIHQLEFFRK